MCRIVITFTPYYFIAVRFILFFFMCGIGVTVQNYFTLHHLCCYAVILKYSTE